MTTISDIKVDIDFYSDLYKDRMGFRPRADISQWMNTELHTQAQIDTLAAEIRKETMRVSATAMPLDNE